MRRLFFCLLVLNSAILAAQKSNVPPPPPLPSSDTSQVYDLVSIEQPASFPGGDSALYGFIGRNVRYPNLARDNGFEGKVFITYVIDRTGEVTMVEVFKGASVPEKLRTKYANDPEALENLKAIARSLDDESLRVVKIMPKWNPGMQDGKPVRMRYILPLSFKLT